LAAQYRNLVPQRQHLGSDRRLAAGQDRQPPKQAHREQIQEAKTHDRRACLTATLLQNSKSTRTREVLERYRELRWVEHVRATIPTPDDTTTLHIPTGLPVLITRRVTTDTHGRPIAMEETRRSAEDTQLTYLQTPTTD
jgi:DNA-binding GntR family transcriptional regulator